MKYIIKCDIVGDVEKTLAMFKFIKNVIPDCQWNKIADNRMTFKFYGEIESIECLEKLAKLGGLIIEDSDWLN